MESFLPSEIGRLIYGYLSESDQELADMFLNSSNVMEECRISKNRSRRFSAKVQGLSLVDILDQYSILCSLIFKNITRSDYVHRNIVNMLRNVLYSKLGEHNKLLAEKFLTQETTKTVPVEQLEQPSETISLSESEPVPVNNIGDDKFTEVLEECSPIDLTSPCPPPQVLDSPKVTKNVENETTTSITPFKKSNDHQIPNSSQQNIDKPQEKRETPKKRTSKVTPSKSDKIRTTKPKSLTPVKRQICKKHELKTHKEALLAPSNPIMNTDKTVPRSQQSGDQQLKKSFAHVRNDLDLNSKPNSNTTNTWDATRPLQSEDQQLKKSFAHVRNDLDLNSKSNSNATNTWDATKSLQSEDQQLEKSFAHARNDLDLNSKSNSNTTNTWDANLRQFIPEETELAAKTLFRTPKKCKRETNCKVAENAAKKRKLEESLNARVKRICKNKSRSKDSTDADPSTDVQRVESTPQNTSVERPPSAQNNVADKHQTETQPVTKPKLTQWLNLGKKPRNTSNRDLPNIKRTPESKPIDGKNSPTVIKQPSERLQTQKNSKEKESSPQLQPQTLPSNGMDIINDIMRKAAENVACKTELESVTSVVESTIDPDDSYLPPAVISLQAEIVAFDRKVNSTSFF